MAEKLYWAICRRIQKMAGELDYFPEELEGLEGLLVGYLFLQLLAVPEHAGQLGREAAFPDHADSPAWTSRRRGTPCSGTSPAIRMARWTSSSTGAT